MKIGIVVYSETGNTYSVSTRLYDELRKKYSISINRIEAIRDKKTGLIEFNKYPDVKDCNIIIFASFVEGFSLNPVMKKYLKELKTLKDKKLLCFVTEAFPFAWMGGNHTIKQMREICDNKGGNILNTGVINWMNKKREDMIKDLIQKFVKTIGDIK